MTSTSTALTPYEPPPKEMTRLQAAFSKDLSNPAAIKEFATVCHYYDLDPFMGEIVPMHGRIYVEEAGWLRHIQQKTPGQLVEYAAGICDKDERELMGMTDGWLAWGKVVRRYPNGNLFPVRELATVSKDELGKATGYEPVAREPWRMAMKRARVRALRIAFREVLHTEAVEAGEAPIEVEAMAESEPPVVRQAPAPEVAEAPVSEPAPVEDTAPTPPDPATGSSGAQVKPDADFKAEVVAEMHEFGVTVDQLCAFLGGCAQNKALTALKAWIAEDPERTVRSCLEAAKAEDEEIK